MKKIITIITCIAIVIITTGFISYKTFTVKRVSKNINVEIFKDASYNAPVYADTYATLNITVIKVNGVKRDTAFTHDFTPMQLKNFPASDKPLVHTIAVNNVNDKNERLEVYYTLTYDTKGSQLVFSNAAMVGSGEQNKSVSIKI